MGSDSLFGGVATSLWLTTIFVNKYKYPLRLIVRNSEALVSKYIDILDLMDIEIPENFEIFTDYNHGNSRTYRKLDVSQNDIFLATSWWSAYAINKINRKRKFFYILQEVESLFYANNDRKVLCNSMLHSDNIYFIINTELLLDYFKQHGYSQIEKNSVIFEPTFFKKIYQNNLDNIQTNTNGKRKLFFYARPNNGRNLFYSGIKFLNEAIKLNIIDTKKWDIYFAGSHDVPNFHFDNGVKPINLGILSWREYVNFVKTVDLAFVMMYTPHPSYIPLDIVSAGGVVVTNTYENKLDLDKYSPNIITVPLLKEDILSGFKKAIDIVNNKNMRINNYNKTALNDGLEEVFKDVVDFMNEKIKTL